MRCTPRLLAGLAALALALPLTAGAARAQSAPPSASILRRDLEVTVASQVPGHVGRPVRIAVRQRVRADLDTAAAYPWDRHTVVVVHGASYGGTSLFDVPEESLLARLAAAGFDAYALDLSGYGRSWHPPAMDDPCNLPTAGRQLLGLSCSPTTYRTTTTSGSDLAELDAVVDFVRARRGISRVHLFGGSLGGARALHYAWSYPQKVSRLVIQGTGGSGKLGRTAAPASLQAFGTPMGAVSIAGYRDRVLDDPCDRSLIDPAVVDATWREILAADPLAASWGPGLSRYPTQVLWGNSAEVYAGIAAPTLVISGACDPAVAEAAAQALYQAIGAADKVRAFVAGAGHIMHLSAAAPHLAAVTAAWLRDGALDGRRRGVVDVELDGARTWR